MIEVKVKMMMIDEDDRGASDDDDDHDGDKIINIPCLNTSSATVNAFCNGVFSGTICNNLRENNEQWDDKLCTDHDYQLHI